MKLDTFLQERSGNQCELTGVTENLAIYEVNPDASSNPDRNVYITQKCINQIEKKEELDTSFWESFLLSSSESVPISNNKLNLGTWQSVFFIELDGPRHNRIINITVIGE